MAFCQLDCLTLYLTPFGLDMKRVLTLTAVLQAHLV